MVNETSWTSQAGRVIPLSQYTDLNVIRSTGERLPANLLRVSDRTVQQRQFPNFGIRFGKQMKADHSLSFDG
jgi:hypothetical protein